MSDTDAGTVKAKVQITYDGSGVDKAKKDLESLADIVGGPLAEGTGAANDALSDLDDQMGKSADSVDSLVSSVGSLEKPLERGASGIVSVSEALGEQQDAIEETGKAYESLQKPVENTVSMLDDVPVTMQAISKNAESMQKQLDTVNESFAGIGDSLSQSVPLLPQFAENLHTVSEEFDPQAFGLDDFVENMSVFQDALANPEPYELMHQYLKETGQTWDDFNSSIGSDNATILDNYTAFRDAMVNPQPFQMIQQHLDDTGQSWNDFRTSIGEDNSAILTNMSNGVGVTEDLTKQFDNLNESVVNTGKSLNVLGGFDPNRGFGGIDPEKGYGVLGGLIGPPEAPGGFLGDLGSIFEGAGDIMMPLMALQMGFQMVTQFAGAATQGIYNMAVVAEGPAAHSVGSFTGSVDALAQTTKGAAAQFSEAFGKGIQPTVEATNTSIQLATGNVANLGKTLGQITGGAIDIGEILLAGFTGSGALMQSGIMGLMNIGSGGTAFPGSSPSSQVQVNLPQIQQQLAQTTAVMTAQANNPQYLAAQAYLNSQAGYAQLGQQYYDVSHTTGMSAFDYTPASYQQAMMKMVAQGGAVAGISDTDVNRAFFESLENGSLPNVKGGQNLPVEATWNPDFDSLNGLLPGPSGGCFPAGTPVLMADGSEQAIETLQIGRLVLAYDGERQVVMPIVDLITFPAKRVYEITFADGSTLTLTDSHPIMTGEGWKSISPRSTKKENPDLPVTTLKIRDQVVAVEGERKLIAIRPRGIVPVFNITVAGPHTYYASDILVHNSKNNLMQNFANSEVPPMDMKNTPLMQSLTSNFTGADLSHTFTATVSWAANGLDHGFIGVASWVGQGLANTFNGIASWIGQGLSNTFNGVASWIGQGLSNTFNGVASWIGQGLSNTFNGVASWIGQGLSNTFNGIASWIGNGLSNTFHGIANWIGQGLSNTFHGAADWIGQNLRHTFIGIADWVMQQVNQISNVVPGFASGVENFKGGLAVTGENGPELVYLPQGSSVYPQNSGFSPLDMLSSGNTANTNGPVVIQLYFDSRMMAEQILPHMPSLVSMYAGGY